MGSYRETLRSRWHYREIFRCSFSRCSSLGPTCPYYYYYYFLLLMS